jgi:hypothetical protein
MKTLLLHIFSGKDNQTIDVARVLWVLGVLSFIGYAGYHVFGNHLFDPISYGTGLGGALAGGGAGVGLKSKTEPGS